MARSLRRRRLDSVDAWRAHREEVRDEPVADGDDIAWADAVLIGTPAC